MIGCIGTKSDGRLNVCLGAIRAPATALGLAFILAGCSSIPESVNPATWFEASDDSVVVARGEPAPTGTEQPKAEPPKAEPPRGLVADRSNAQYAPTVRREVAPTKPLARRAPAPGESQTAATPAPKPASPAAVEQAPVPAAEPAPNPGPDARAPAPAGTPAVAQAPAPAEVPRSSVARTQPVARDTGPAAPPASIDMAAPARPVIPEVVDVANRRPKLLQAQFEKRLAESAQTVVRPDVVEPSRTAARDDEPIHLIAPSSQRKSAAKGLAAPMPDAPAASFQVAALDFQAGSAELTRADRAAIADVARLYKQTGGGIVRVVGIAPSYNGGIARDAAAASIQRANAVARELARRGVPASRIMVGGDASPAPGEPVGARIFMDVL